MSRLWGTLTRALRKPPARTQPVPMPCGARQLDLPLALDRVWGNVTIVAERMAAGSYPSRG